jgi:hypothetical protein
VPTIQYAAFLNFETASASGDCLGQNTARWGRRYAKLTKTPGRQPSRPRDSWR